MEQLAKLHKAIAAGEDSLAVTRMVPWEVKG